MGHSLQQFLRVGTAVVVLGQLSACGAMGGAIAGAALEGAVIGAMWGSGVAREPRQPEIFCTAEDSIGLTYGTAGSSSARDEAMQLISEHCESGLVETYREHTDYTHSTKVYVACLQTDGSPPDSPSCIYVTPEVTPIGFGDDDPAIANW